MRARRFRLSAGGLLLASSATLLVWVALPTGASAADQGPFVQKQFAQVTSGNSVSATFGLPNRAGHLIIAYVVWDNAGTVAVTDSTGNGYASAVGPTQPGGGGGNAQIFYAREVAGGANTVTATFATAISTRGLLL
jgi:hypothetical protein